MSRSRTGRCSPASSIPTASFEAHHATDKFWEKAEADAALAGTKSPGVVKEVASGGTRAGRPRPTTPPPSPPTPRAASASRRRGRCGSPRTSTWTGSSPTRGPTTRSTRTRCNTRELVSSLVRIPEFEAAAPLLDGDLTPTRGKKETTDHPPIYPTQALHPNALDGPKATRVRADRAALPRHLLAADDHRVHPRRHRGRRRSRYFVRGSVVIDPGYAAIYTYARSADEEIPKLSEGQKLELEGDPWLVDKETQPPSRISQGRLVELMEERGLGTKATRADIIQKLYDRGYVFGNPPEPSETGIAMYRAFHDYVPRMATPEMTAELEEDMDQIAAGKTSKDEVLRISREMLHGDDHRARGKAGGPGQADLERDGRGQVPRPLQGLRGGRPKARGRLAQPPADHRAQGRQADVRLRGLEPRRPRVARFLPGQRPAPRPRLRPLATRGALLDLRRDAAAHRQGLPRPSLEALPERRLPVDGRDAAEARGAKARAGGQEGGAPRPPARATTGATVLARAATAAGAASRRRRPRAASRPAASRAK